MREAISPRHARRVGHDPALPMALGWRGGRHEMGRHKCLHFPELRALSSPPFTAFCILESSRSRAAALLTTPTIRPLMKGREQGRHKCLHFAELRALSSPPFTAFCILESSRSRAALSRLDLGSRPKVPRFFEGDDRVSRSIATGGTPDVHLQRMGATGRFGEEGGVYSADEAQATIVIGLSRHFSMPSRGYAVPARFAERASACEPSGGRSRARRQLLPARRRRAAGKMPALHFLASIARSPAMLLGYCMTR
jgi:hypothetical protein